ncbi:MAG: 50S ribosomal protein L19 [Verrucomicrobia bacterium]|nr:50S ribosomal protein L19 [Verrucomicrobiota bacterium]
MVSSIVEAIGREAKAKSSGVPKMSIGDTLKVHVKIKEGDKERVQIFSGTLIAIKGGGGTEMFTVRRISHGVGVERVFPMYSPHIAKIEVESSMQVRRAKLYFLRRVSGKKARLKEDFGGDQSATAKKEQK